jgi:hypothetical protein
MTMTARELPKVDCPLAGQDGNAFAILGRFRQAARKAGWPQEEIQKALDEAMSGDYSHLLVTIAEHIAGPEIVDCRGPGGECMTVAAEEF